MQIKIIKNNIKHNGKQVLPVLLNWLPKELKI